MSESDKFNLLDVENFKNALSVWEIRQQSISSEDIVLTVIIKYDCLRHFYEAKQEEEEGLQQIRGRFTAHLWRGQKYILREKWEIIPGFTAEPT